MLTINQLKRDRAVNHIDSKMMFSLMFTYLMLIIALHSSLYLWISAIAVLFILWRFLFQQKKTSLPSLTALNLLAIGCSVLIAYFSMSAGILQGMTNLLMLGAAMKLLGLKRSGEVKHLCLTMYFIIAAAFIFNQGISFAVFVLAIFVINSYTLLMVHSPGLNLRKRLRFGLRFLLTSLPLTLFLFVLMPRLGPLWKMPVPKGQSTGLSENISPGDISNLAQSSDLVFRVVFDAQTPENKDLYWRTMVHETFDGKQWSIHRLRKIPQNITTPRPARGAQQQPILNYSVVAEPSYQSWIYALDTPISHSPKLNYHYDRRLTSQRPLSQKFQYQVSSVKDHPSKQRLYPLEREINLQLPSHNNPKTLAFATQLRRQSDSDIDYVNKVLSVYVDNQFIYTLEPLLMPVDPVDTFLFAAKAGFCSHFASSFALLMRAGGIPARIVSGYQGGERADADEFISVYQYDAHAWNEVWLEGLGWRRVDPTATVSPERIAQGLQAAMANGQSFLAGQMFSLIKLRQYALLNWLRDQVNNMDFLWSSWVLNFDSKKQSRLFESLWGKHNALIYSVYIALIFTAFMGFIYLLSRDRSIKQDHSLFLQLHQQALGLGKIYHFSRPNSVPPMSYLTEFGTDQPQLKSDLAQLSGYYQQCLYQDLSDQQFTQVMTNAKKLIKQLKRQAPHQWRRFKLRFNA